ncbi:MAG: V-type ATP synthase subunit I [Desulfovermiculus sp.]
MEHRRMIVPMKKVTLLCQAKYKEQALQLLQQAGLVHLSVAEGPADTDLEKAQQEVHRLEQTADVLELQAASFSSTGDMTAKQAADSIWNSLQRLRRTEDKIQELSQEKARIQPFGDFDPHTAQALKENGVSLVLCRVPNAREHSLPSQVLTFEVSSDHNFRYLALFSREKISPPGPEVTLPEKSLSEISRQLDEMEEEKIAIRQEIRSLSAYRPQILRLLAQARDRVSFLQARAGMDILGPVAVLQGYIPKPNQSAVLDLARKGGWGCQITDPGVDDQPPTLIHTPRWVRPIQTVFSLINIVPGYREADISAPFLLFLSLFFAMIIGDAGYGALFLATTFLFRRHLDRMQPELFPFLLIMSLSTVIWGLLTGNVLGTSPSGPFFTAFQVDWLTGPGADDRIMLLCFLLGAVHLSLAHAWHMILLWPSLRILAQLGWIMLIWVMFFAARSLVLLHDFPDILLGLLGLGLLLILAFMRPLHTALSQWTEYVRLPLDIISQFVDVVSYVRLFAVGTATVAVAQAFNQMALSLGFSGIVSSFGAALILFVGHSMNIALAAMGVLVHGVRLNTLEFASHAGITWSGTRFQPFAFHAKGEQHGT